MLLRGKGFQLQVRFQFSKKNIQKRFLLLVELPPEEQAEPGRLFAVSAALLAKIPATLVLANLLEPVTANLVPFISWARLTPRGGLGRLSTNVSFVLRTMRQKSKVKF